MYQRFSAHLTSVDIPDLSELKETARETANRVESALSRNSSNESAASSGAPKSQISRAASLSEQQLKAGAKCQGAVNPPPASAGAGATISRSQSVLGPVAERRK